jgi:sortase A
VGNPSRARRLLATTSMLGSVAALVVAAVLFGQALDTEALDTARSRQEPKASLPPFDDIPPSPSPSPPPSPSPSPPSPELPSEGAPPRQKKAGPAIVQIGVMEIPKINLVHPVFEGIDLRIINHGPGHWPGSAMPGRPGNSVFAGHRVTHSHPFLHIDQLVPGDRIIFRTAAGTAVYEMTEHMIVFPKDVWIADPTAGSIVTFFGCHPPHSARQRYVVRGKLVSTQPA